jgi:hypothetical protein
LLYEAQLIERDAVLLRVCAPRRFGLSVEPRSRHDMKRVFPRPRRPNRRTSENSPGSAWF